MSDRSPAADGALVVDTYYYDDEQGRRWAKVERTIPKGFRQSMYLNKEWHPCKAGGLAKPYKLRELVQAPPQTDVWFCEGEKDANRLIKEGLLATTAAEGADKFTMEHVPWFMGRSRVFVLQDNDDRGREHAQKIARLLKPVVHDVRIVTFDELPLHGDVTDWFEAGGTKDALIERALASPQFKDAIAASAFTLPDPREIPRREWLYWPHYIRGYPSLTVAPGGVGKSALTVSEVLAMVTGRDLLGVRPQSRLRVWYLNLEDPMDELHRRFAAAASYFGITQDEIGDRLFINSGRTTPLVLATEKNRSAVIDQHIVRSTVNTIRSNEIDVVIVDPFVASHRLQENDNAQIDQLARTYAQIAEETQTAVMLVHHTRKMGADRGTVDDGRGASSLLAAARSARLLTVMSAVEASNAGIDERDRRRYFRADHGKSNLTPPADAATWFLMRSVDLGNESRDLDRGDNVGVVTAFNYPTVHQLRVTEGDVRRVLGRISQGGPWREDVRALAWVGAPIAEALLLGPLDGPKKRQVVKLIKDWLANGILKTVVRKDGKSNSRAFIEPGEFPSVDGVKDEDEQP